VKSALGVHIPVRRAIQLGRVLLEWVGAELLNINRDRRRQPLGAEVIKPDRRAVRMGEGLQSIFFPRLVAGRQRRAILDRGGGAGNTAILGFCAMGVSL